MRLPVMALLMLAIAAPAGAAEATDAQKNVIKHIADAYVIAEKCPRSEINWPVVEAAMAMHGLPKNAFSEGGPFEAAAKGQIVRAKRETEAFSGDRACAIARAMFGPDGANVPDFLLFR